MGICGDAHDPTHGTMVCGKMVLTSATQWVRTQDQTFPSRRQGLGDRIDFPDPMYTLPEVLVSLPTPDHQLQTQGLPSRPPTYPLALHGIHETDVCRLLFYGHTI